MLNPPQQRKRADEYMDQRFPEGLAFIQACVESQRYGHAHNEQKGREHQVTKVIPFLPWKCRIQAGTICGKPGNVIDKNHREHDQPAKRIDGHDARAANTGVGTASEAGCAAVLGAHQHASWPKTAGCPAPKSQPRRDAVTGKSQKRKRGALHEPAHVAAGADAAGKGAFDLSCLNVLP